VRYHTPETSDTYSIALLIKSSAFVPTELDKVYTAALTKANIDKSQLVYVTADYNDKGKAPVPFIKEYLESLLPQLLSIGVKHIYCADAEYFKVLTGNRKAEPHLGYIFPCKLEGFNQIQVTLGVNHRSLLYNPANEAKMDLSLATLVSMVNGGYQQLGTGIIHHAVYPSSPLQISLELDKLHAYPELALDLETFSLKFDKAGIGTISLCWSKHEGIAFACDYKEHAQPQNGEYGYYQKNPKVRALIRDFLESYKGKLVFHNSTFDCKVSIAHLWMADWLDTEGLLKGLEIMFRDFDDTKIIAYLATNSTAGNDLGLKSLAHPFAGNWAQSEIKDIRRIPLADLLQYNLVDGLSTLYVKETYYPIMVQDEQEDLYQSLMKDSLKVITQKELTGMPLNPTRVQEVRQELEAITGKHLETIMKSAGVKAAQAILKKTAFDKDFVSRKAKAKNPDKIKPKDWDMFEIEPFNPGSGLQLQTLLYTVFELPVIDLTDTKQPATGKDTLDKLINHTKIQNHKDILQALIDYSEANKILSTFIPAFENAIHKGTDVVWLHGNFNLGGTVSGRLSSSDPNLQNLPSGSTYGKLIKSCFMAPDGWLFVGSDFNSLEDYISALTTKDPNKLKVYLEGYDGHSLRAYSYWPEKFPDIEPTPASVNTIKNLHDAIRRESKAPTFALTYQGTWNTLMNNCGFTEEEAKKIEANYHELYKVSDQWVQDRLTQASKDGFVAVAFGLRVRTPLLAKCLRGSKYTPYEAQAEGRTAGNALGQSYGLLTNRAFNAFMRKVWASPYRTKILPCAAIHDAIYLLIKNEVGIVEWVNKTLIEEMQWQELPEIQHETVKLGSELSIFWPTWADELTLPNGATQKEILQAAAKHHKSYLEKKAA
jgi:DNA polymerase-1